jgi:hypothetical protein
MNNYDRVNEHEVQIGFYDVGAWNWPITQAEDSPGGTWYVSVQHNSWASNPLEAETRGNCGRSSCESFWGMSMTGTYERP